MFLMISLGAVLVGRGVVNVTAIPAHAATFDVAPSAAVSDLIELFADPDEPAMTPAQIDRYGNEVDDAVGDYRIDSRGDEFEGHSPETEISRLTSPIG
jgi:hypothetical protein